MQNRYVGDLGDFGKFGLLRAICAPGETCDAPPLSLGVVWYLVPDEAHNEDGRFVRYLDSSARNQDHFRSCDPTLYDTLQKIVRSGDRNIARIQDGGVLPLDTRYYEAPLTFEGLRGTGGWMRRQRVERRTRWFKDALQSADGCDVVFLDPDNGFEVKVGAYQLRGPKYTFFNELLPFVQRDQSLIVYQHVARRGSAKNQIRGLMARIQDKLARQSFALLYHRGSSRSFFVLPAQRHGEVLSSKTEMFLQTPWRRHFELVTAA